MSGPMLRPLIAFELEIASLARQGHTRVSVPDLGLYAGESLDEGLRRMRALTRFAKRLKVTLFVRNEAGGDLAARPLPANDG
jgi:hypothetical protein